MTTGATGQLGLALPVQGELSGTWGDTVNNGITQYTNIAIAGTLTLTGDGAVTLANTTGDASASNITSSLTGAGTVTAQFAIVKVTGTLTTAKVVTAPSYSKTYTVVNSATGGIVTFKASGQTGVSIAVGETAFVYYNGTDYVKVAGTTTTSSQWTTTGSNIYYNTGNVGIGTSSPATKLQVVGDTVTSNVSFGTATSSAGTLASDTGGSGGRIILWGSTSANTGLIQIITAAAAPITFTSNSIERGRFDTSGNFGVGTATPVAQLGVYGTGQTTAAMSTSSGVGGTLYVRDSASGAGNGGAVMFGAAQGAFAAIKGLLVDGSSNTVGALAFSTRNAAADSTLTERMRLDSAGYLSGVWADKVSALGNSGTAKTITCTAGNVFTATLTGNCTFTLSAPSTTTANTATSFTLILTNDATAGRTVAWAGGTFLFPGGAASLSRTTTANATDVWFFFSPNGGTTWYGNISQKNLIA